MQSLKPKHLHASDIMRASKTKEAILNHTSQLLEALKQLYTLNGYTLILGSQIKQKTKDPSVQRIWFASDTKFLSACHGEEEMAGSMLINIELNLREAGVIFKTDEEYHFDSPDYNKKANNTAIWHSIKQQYLTVVQMAKSERGVSR